MRHFSLIASTVAVVLALLTLSASAVTLINHEQCYIINPDPTFLSCSQYSEPYTDVLTTLPYDTVPEYTQCVRERCVCSQQKDSVDGSWTTSGLMCSPTAGYNESGALTCNAMVDCFRTFWECVTDALMDRYYAQAALDATETAAVTDIIQHGHDFGESFAETNVYRSCRMIMCDAAASRKNCGLLTCIPNNTQCYEYMKPPPLPNVHQLCTQGCRAVLVLMAVTLVVIAMAFCCCACCPAAVNGNRPLVTIEDEGNKAKRRRDSDAPDSNFDISSHDGTTSE